MSSADKQPQTLYNLSKVLGSHPPFPLPEHATAVKHYPHKTRPMFISVSVTSSIIYIGTCVDACKIHMNFTFMCVSGCVGCGN